MAKGKEKREEGTEKGWNEQVVCDKKSKGMIHPWRLVETEVW
jgi:hypothetical protein